MFGQFVAVGPGDHVRTAQRGPQVPFENVFLHGLIRDEFGRKMSKSRGNGIDPLDWVEMFGADALRFTLARGASPGGDLSIGEDHARASRNFATKLFNATRFALMNGASPASLPAAADLTDADRWILGRAEEVRAEVDSAFDNYEFSRACESLYHFAWDEFCDWYLELAKVQLADGIAHTTAVLAAVLDTLLKLLASGDAVRHRDAVEDAHGRRVAGHRRLAGPVRLRGRSGCGPTHHRYAEAGDRGASVPQRSGTRRPAEGARTADGRGCVRSRLAGTGGHVAGMADARLGRIRSDGIGRGAADAVAPSWSNSIPPAPSTWPPSGAGSKRIWPLPRRNSRAPQPSSTTRPSWPRRPSTSSTRSAAASSSPRRKSTASQQGWRLCNDTSPSRHRTKSPRCFRSSTYSTSDGRRPSSNRARPASQR